MMSSLSFFQTKKIKIGVVQTRTMPPMTDAATNKQYQVVKIEIISDDGTSEMLTDIACFGTQIEVECEKEPGSEELEGESGGDSPGSD